MHHFCSMPPMSVTKMMPEVTHQKQAALGPQPDAQIPQPVMKMNDVRNSPASVPSKPATYQNSAKDLNAIKVRVGICFLSVFFSIFVLYMRRLTVSPVEYIRDFINYINSLSIVLLHRVILVFFILPAAAADSESHAIPCCRG